MLIHRTLTLLFAAKKIGNKKCSSRNVLTFFPSSPWKIFDSSQCTTYLLWITFISPMLITLLIHKLQNNLGKHIHALWKHVLGFFWTAYLLKHIFSIKSKEYLPFSERPLSVLYETSPRMKSSGLILFRKWLTQSKCKQVVQSSVTLNIH